MKLIAVFLGLVIFNITFGQSSLFERSTHWRLYGITGSNLFKYRIDTLGSFPYAALTDDSIHYFLNDASVWPPGDPPVWMGSHIGTYIFEGIERKVDISLYGGFFFDEKSQTYYQIADSKIDNWQSYIRRSFMRIKK
ncbi:MAG TPA: hypothetical protein VHC48_19545 [Puia sp.]|nr:hypothetical protein [Puia sp.]